MVDARRAEADPDGRSGVVEAAAGAALDVVRLAAARALVTVGVLARLLGRLRAVVVLRGGGLDRLAGRSVLVVRAVLAVVVVPQGGLRDRAVRARVLLRRRAVRGGRRVTVARVIAGEVFRGGLRGLLFRGRGLSVLTVVVVVVISVTVVIESGRGRGGLVRDVAAAAAAAGTPLDVVVAPLLVVGIIVALIAGARLNGGGLRELGVGLIADLVARLRAVAAARFQRGDLREGGAPPAVTLMLIVVRARAVVDVVVDRGGPRGRAGRLVAAVRVLVRRAGSIRGRRHAVPLCALTPTVDRVLLLRSGGRRGRRDHVRRRPMMIVSITVVVVDVVVAAVLTDGRRRRGSGGGGRRRVVVAVAVVRLFPTDLPHPAALLLRLVLSRVLLVRLLGPVALLPAVPAVVEAAAAAAAQQIPIIVVVVVAVAVVALRGRGHAVHRVRGRAHRVAGLATLKVILRLGVAAQVVVVDGLQAGADSVQVEVVAGVIKSRGLAVHVVPVRAGLTLLVEGGVVGTQESKSDEQVIEIKSQVGRRQPCLDRLKIFSEYSRRRERRAKRSLVVLNGAGDGDADVEDLTVGLGVRVIAADDLVATAERGFRHELLRIPRRWPLETQYATPQYSH